MDKVRRFCKPDIITAKLRTAWTMQGVVATPDLFFEDSAIFIVWRKYHPFAIIVLPIPGLNEPDTDTVG
jgi:hypothetical protein